MGNQTKTVEVTGESAGESPAEGTASKKTADPASPKRSPLHRDAMAGEASFTVIHQANGAGALEDCGCNMNPLGGLARRAKWLQDQGPLLGDTLLLDGGDLFSDGNVLDMKGNAEHAMVLDRGHVIVDAYNQMGYRAMALGDRDLLLGLEALKKLESTSDFPFLGANIRDKNNNSPFPSSVTVKAGTQKVAIIGLVSATTPNQKKIIEAGELVVLDPFETLRTEIAAMKTQADYVWVLGHMKGGEAEIILEEVPEVTLVLGGQDIISTDQLTWIDGAATTQGGEKGKKMGITTMVFSTPGARFEDPSRNTRISSKIGQLEAKVEARSQALKKALTQDEKGASNIDWLKKNLVKLRTELQGLKMELEDMSASAGKATNPMVFDRIELHRSLPGDATIEKEVNALKERFPGLAKQGGNP